MVEVKPQIGGFTFKSRDMYRVPHCCEQTHEKMCKYNFLAEFTNVKPGISNKYISSFSIYTKRS